MRDSNNAVFLLAAQLKGSLERRSALRRTLGGGRLRSCSPLRCGTRKFTILRLEELETRLKPTVLTVNTTADVVNPSDGTLRLHDAIAAIDVGNANGLASGETDVGCVVLELSFPIVLQRIRRSNDGRERLRLRQFVPVVRTRAESGHGPMADFSSMVGPRFQLDT
jgi:hypothetical protein